LPARDSLNYPRTYSTAAPDVEAWPRLQPFARGAVVTTSRFSRAAINEASEEGKNPIALIDGFALSRMVIDEKFQPDL
jgi:hypothetical protein